MAAASVVAGTPAAPTASTPATTTATTVAGDDRTAVATIGAPQRPRRPPTREPPTVVDGAVFHNKWGDVQVEVTSPPTDRSPTSTTLKTPYVDDKSVRINERAVPRLNSEALTAQSADVDTVSGATYTSNDYRRSLQSAIDAANAAGITTIG